MFPQYNSGREVVSPSNGLNEGDTEYDVPNPSLYIMRDGNLLDQAVCLSKVIPITQPMPLAGHPNTNVYFCQNVVR